MNYSFKNNENYSGLIRHPKTSDFYLYSNIKGNNNEPNISSSNISSFDHNLFVNNLNVKKFLDVKIV